jgi:hypothetical protein
VYNPVIMSQNKFGDIAGLLRMIAMTHEH